MSFTTFCSRGTVAVPPQLEFYWLKMSLLLADRVSLLEILDNNGISGSPLKRLSE